MVLLLYHGIEHVGPLWLQAAETLRSGFGGLNNAELKRSVHKDLGVLPPGEETRPHTGVEGKQPEDVDLYRGGSTPVKGRTLS